MGLDPVGQRLGCGGFDIGVIAGSQGGDKNLRFKINLAGDWIEDGDRLPGIIDEGFFTSKNHFLDYFITFFIVIDV